MPPLLPRALPAREGDLVPELKKCASCAFWDCLDDGVGHCRRHAPAPHIVSDADWNDGEGHNRPMWPITRHTDACGEYRRCPS